MLRKGWRSFSVKLLAVCALPHVGAAQPASVRIDVNWNQIVATSKTAITVQDCPEPPLLRKAATHDPIYQALRDLQADYARLQPWYPYPRIAVAELKPPDDGQTFWDFKLMDEVTEDFIRATAGHTVVFNLGTIPTWMFKTKAPVHYPSNADDIDWDYDQGTELRDSSLREIADYQARLASWYIKGGFTDELEKWHASNHHFKVDYWEVLNEIDLEHHISPELYTRIYDAVVEKVQKVSPTTKFIGLSLADAVHRPEYFTYFLDQRNHKRGIPIDLISFHFYSLKPRDIRTQDLPETMFEQADKFLTAVRYIDAIRKKLSPKTGIDIDELGSMLPDGQASQMAEPISPFYWNAAGAMWAYVFGHVTAEEIDALGGAEIIDYPGQFAATTLLEWDTGKPNARYRVLKLLHDDFAPGDKLAETKTNNERVYVQAFLKPDGRRKILIVNERAKPITLDITGARTGEVESVDLSTGADLPSKESFDSPHFTLQGLAVAVITLR